MSEAWTKLFHSITNSTIWGEDSDTRVVWVTMLAMADRNGYVGASLTGLAREAVVPLESAERALAKFLAPDPYSRSQEHEGRRIAVADRGWVILNYGRFRDMRDEEARREYERKRKREQRRPKGMSRNVPDVPECPTMSAQAEAEAVTDTEPNHPALPTTLSDDEAFEMAWKLYPKRPNNSKAAALRAWQARRAKNVPVPVLVDGVRRYAAYVASQGVEPRFVKMASTFFGPDEHYLTDFTVPSQLPGLSAQERRSVAAGEQFLGEVAE